MVALMPELASNNSDIEQECVRLAAVGLTEAQIADRLGITPRETRRILAKHGFRPDATDLPAFLGRLSDGQPGQGRKTARPKDAASLKLSKRRRKTALEYQAKLEGGPHLEALKKHTFQISLKGAAAPPELKGARDNTIVENPVSEIYTEIDGVYISDSVRSLDFREKLKILDDYVAMHPGQPVSSLAAELFADSKQLGAAAPSIEQLELPIVAPALWSIEKSRRESPPDFIKRVYAPWIGNGLARQHIRHLDRKLYQALATWIGRNGQLDFELPTNVEVTDRWIDRVRSGEAAKPEGIRDYHRLKAAIYRRQGSQRESNGK